MGVTIAHVGNLGATVVPCKAGNRQPDMPKNLTWKPAVNAEPKE